MREEAQAGRGEKETETGIGKETAGKRIRIALRVRRNGNEMTGEKGVDDKNIKGSKVNDRKEAI